MNPLTLEWIAKAEGDFATASREIGVAESPNYDAVCFHTQQCAEKYLKAHLQAAGLVVPKIHILETLLPDLSAVNPRWNSLLAECTSLTDYAVRYRYPGLSATEQEAMDALSKCRVIRTFARSQFGLT